MKVLGCHFLFLLLILKLGDHVHGFQYPLQYHYHYRARVTSGIPEINNKQIAASDIKADLYVYVTSPTTAVFKLDDVQVAEFHGQTNCELSDDEPLPVEYRYPQSSESGFLIGQHAFQVSQTLTFHAEDPLWLVNFYKGIISIFSTAPFRTAVFGTNETQFQNDAYIAAEHTVMGACDGTYTQFALSGLAANEYKKFVDEHIEEDVQLDPAPLTSKTGQKTRGRKTGGGTKRPPSQQLTSDVPVIDPTVWKVSRSVNLEKCLYSVEHQHTPTGVYCSLARDQCKNLFSRNSQSVYFLRGNEDGVRLEKAIVKGSIVVAPFGFETDVLITKSSQKLALVSVTSTTSPVPAIDSAREDNRLEYTMILPYEGMNVPSYSTARIGTLRQALEQFTAHTVSEEEQQQKMSWAIEYIKGSLDKLSEPVEGTNVAPQILNYASIILYDFNQQQMDEFMSAILQDASPQLIELLFGVLTEVGSLPSINSAVELINQGSISVLRQATFFATVKKNLKSAAPLKTLLDLLSSYVIDDSEFLVGQAYVNFATTIYKFCNTNSNSGSFADFASLTCERDNIVPRFTEMAIRHLENSDKFWKQIVFAKTLANLRSAEATNALMPYILGNRECDTMVRLVALEALAKWSVYSSAPKEKITLTLLELFENPAENRFIRSRALSYLTSWPLSSTIWMRLAFTTKRPMFKDLSAFTYSVIKTMAGFKHHDTLQQSLYASHALRLARPSAPAARYASFKTWYTYNFDDKIAALRHVWVIKDPLSPIPSDIGVFLRLGLGGSFRYKELDFMLANDFGDLDSIFTDLFTGQGPVYDDNGEPGNWDRFLYMLTGGLDIEKRVRAPVNGLTFVVPDNDVQIIVPFDAEFLINTLASVAASFQATQPQFVYMNTYDATFVTVNDIGLPVILSSAKPTTFTHSAEYNYDTYDQHISLEVKNTRLEFSSTTRTILETMALWSGSKVATGVSHTKTIQLPFDKSIDVYLPNENRESTSYEIKLKPSVGAGSKTLSMVAITNTPYTLLKNTKVGDVLEVLAAKKFVLEDTSQTETQTAFLPIPGVKLVRAGNVPSLDLSPGNLLSVSNAVKLVFTDTIKYWQSDVLVEYARYSGGEFFLSFNKTHLNRASDAGRLVSMYGDARETTGCVGSGPDDFTQQTGQTADYYDYTQQGSNDLEFQTFGSFDEQQSQKAPERYQFEIPTDAELTRPSFGAPDAKNPILNTYLTYLRREKGWKERINGASVRLEVTLGDALGNEKKAYEFAVAYTVCHKHLEQNVLKAVFVLASSEQSCQTICADLELKTPKITDMDTLSSLRIKDLSKQAAMAIYSGPQCREGPLLEFNETRSLTNNAFAEIVKGINECGSVSNDPVVDFVREALYDEFQGVATIHRDVEQTCAPLFIDYLKLLGNKFLQAVHSDSTVNMCKITSDDLLKNSVQAQRTKGNSWSGSISIESSGSGASGTRPFLLEAPDWLEYTVNKLSFDLYSQSELDRVKADYCVINETSLVTFDGQAVSFALDGCPTLAVTQCEEGSFDTFAVGVSSNPMSGGLTVNIAARYKQLVVNVNSQGVQVNGRPALTDSYYQELNYNGEQLAGYIVKHNDAFKVEIKDTLAVIIKDGAAYIKVNHRYFGYLCGLCGNHDSEPVNDMKRPNGCLLTDPEVFRQSWVPASSFQCSSFPSGSSSQCLKDEPLAPQSYLSQLFDTSRAIPVDSRGCAAQPLAVEVETE